MEKEVIVINEPEYLEAREFEEGSLIQVEGKIIEVEKTPIGSGCYECAFKDNNEYCRYAECSCQRFKEIKDHE